MMKRARNLFESIPNWENLLSATARALHGKRERWDALRFMGNLETELSALSRELLSGTYRGSGFRRFVIHDPKRRTISAPVFRDRVAHHAIMNICEPELERFQIHHSYACRIGKGTLAALRAGQTMARRHPYGFWMKMDIRAYFDSVSHARLLHLLERRFAEPELLDLFARILSGHEVQEGRGIPIGSLVSQHFANFYLGHLDHEVTRRMGFGDYVRYMDDFVVWHDDKTVLREAGLAIQGFVREKLDLELKRPPLIQRVRLGMDFLGFRVFPGRLIPSAGTKRRVRQKLHRIDWEFDQGMVPEGLHQIRLQAVFSRLLWPEVSSRHFRERLIGLPRGAAVAGHEPGQPGRQLEQQRQELPVREPQQEHAGEPQQQPGVPPSPV
jgi:retron-type reverse transcriptase